MTSHGNNDDLFRRIERDVLDTFHHQFDLLRRTETDAIEAVLVRYAQVLRDLRTGKIVKPNDSARSHAANEGLRGLGRCLRWIRERCPSSVLVPCPGRDALSREALELLRWGVEYDPLFNQHAAKSRGLVEVDLDEAQKTITFLPPRDVSPHFFCTQTEAKKADDERLAREFPEERLAQLSKSWFESVEFADGMLRFDDRTVNSGGAIEVAAEWLERTFLPELPATIMLVGCAVADVRRLLASIYVYALFGTRLEDVFDDQGVKLGSRVVVFGRDGMVEWLSRLSEVARDRVERVVSMLTFDTGHYHVTLAQQPFVSSRCGRLFLLLRMLLLIDFPRMFIGALNKTAAGQQDYAGAINTIEDVGVRMVTLELRNGAFSGFQVKEKSVFRFAGGRLIEPDIVVVSETTRKVLVIDFKYATPPFSVDQIQHDIGEVEKWKRRMGEYVTAFEAEPEALRQHFAVDPSDMSVRGLILLRWPLPILVDFTEPICAVDWPSLKGQFQGTGVGSIGEMTAWARTRPDVAAPRVLAWTVKELKVGEWTYRYSVLTAVANERLLDVTQKLAYRLWEERGRPLWDDLRDWYHAEAQIAAGYCNVMKP